MSLYCVHVAAPQPSLSLACAFVFVAVSCLGRGSVIEQVLPFLVNTPHPVSEKNARLTLFPNPDPISVKFWTQIHPQIQWLLLVTFRKSM